jgi:hypothetical protein
VNSYIARVPITGFPKGAYDQWSEQDKSKAYKRLGGFCEYLCVDAYSKDAFPNEHEAQLATAEVKVCLSACIINHMPPDYPAMSGLKQRMRANFDEAKRLGSKLPWPLPHKWW